MNSPQPVAAQRVIKKLAPDRPGAQRLAQRFGDALVCVRHRVDASGRTRFTTVELLVEQTPVRAQTGNRIVGIRIAYEDGTLRAVAALRLPDRVVDEGR